MVGTTPINKDNNNNKIFLFKKLNKTKINPKNTHRISPKNYTFKTVFVNNFCILPMNSSFTSNKIKKKD